MALFGRNRLPHRATLSRFLADVDRPCLEAFRTLFEQQSFAEGWTAETIGGIFDRQGRRSIVFDVDATRQAARQRALPCDPMLPPARRRLNAVCAPGYTGRKRGEVVRTRTTALQMHTRQWVGTYAGRGNGDYRGELASALLSIATYLRHFALTSEVALVRLDGQYGDAVVIAQLIKAGVALVTRGRGYQILKHPQLQRVLAHPPTACVTRVNSTEMVELFDGGWLQLGEGLPQARVIVARHRAPESATLVTVGKRIDEWVYELFITTLGADGFLVEDVLDLYHGRGAFEAVLADEDVEGNPDRWCSYTECGQELWQVVWQWVWNLRLALGQTMQRTELREIEWAPPKESPSFLVAAEDPPEEYGPWQWAAAFGRATGRFGADAFTLQEDGKLRCPAGSSLWLSEVRQENAFTQRAVYLAYQTDCQNCSLREQCLASGSKGNRARRVSAVRRLLPSPASVERKPIILGAMRWVDVAGRALRRTWMVHWRRQYVEVIPLAAISEKTSPPPRPPRAVRSHHRWRWQDRLACNAWWGPPQLRLTIAGVPAFLAVSAS
jgi:Transposase DDE domain